MTIGGVNLRKISVERKKPLAGNIQINNNIKVKEITKTDLVLGASKQEGLNFSFEFTTKYEPEFGIISIEGDVLLIEDEKKTGEILKQWKDKKEMTKEIAPAILNAALAKSNIEAIIISQQVGLPSPIPMPSINPKQQENKEGNKESKENKESKAKEKGKKDYIG